MLSAFSAITFVNSPIRSVVCGIIFSATGKNALENAEFNCPACASIVFISPCIAWARVGSKSPFLTTFFACSTLLSKSSRKVTKSPDQNLPPTISLNSAPLPSACAFFNAPPNSLASSISFLTLPLESRTSAPYCLSIFSIALSPSPALLICVLNLRNAELTSLISIPVTLQIVDNCPASFMLICMPRVIT